MFTTLKRLFCPGSPSAPELALALAPPGAPSSRPQEADPFDELWSLLTGVTPLPPPGLTGPEADLVELLAPKVLARCSRNRPDPTAFPALAVRIIDLLNEPDLDINTLLKAINPDPAISIHVLRAANSALYSRGAELTDLRSAVMRIGLTGVGEIAAGVAGRSLFDVELRVEYELFGSRWNDLFLDTMAVAFGASQFAFEQQMGNAGRAFQAGMFHDIGKSLALRALAALMISGEVPSPMPKAVVDEVLEQVHVEVGFALHRHWNLPDYLASICLHHHDLEISAALQHQDFHILRMASGLHRLILAPGDTGRLGELRQSIRATDMVRRNVKHLHTEMVKHVDRVKVLFPA